MGFPATIYAAFGATAAAIIAGWVSTTTIIVAKDQKISEFRQKWIDDLRESVSALIGNFTMLAGAVHFHGVIQKGLTDEERTQAITETISTYCPELLFRFSKIRLMLNTKDDTSVLDLLSKLERDLDGIAANFRDPKALEALLAEFETSIQVLLKVEWERVKDGEPNYKKYKRNSELFPIALFVLVLIWFLFAQVIRG